MLLSDVVEQVGKRFYYLDRVNTLWSDIDYNNLTKEGDIEFPNGKKMSFESRNKCIEYFQKNYGVGIYTIKKLIRTKEKLKSKYKKFKKLEGIRIYYI